jgi:uncharacterized protein (TIGR00369 family)
MSALIELVERARAAGDPALLCEAVPYARFLGATAAIEEGELVLRAPFAEHLVGNAAVPALHGGAVGSLMETAAILETLWRRDPIVRPRTINLTVDYLRPAGLEDVVVTVEVLRSGRRVSTVLARAWQGAPRRLVSVAKVHLMLSG